MDSLLICSLPILSLFILMLGLKVPGWKASIITVFITIVCGYVLFNFCHESDTEYSQTARFGNLIFWSITEGILKGIFPILLIILFAIFSYNILVKSGQIEVIKQQFHSLTDDKRLTILIIVWGFGSLLEAMAGFGTAVAIPAAILIGFGFKPIFSAFVSLLGNTVTSAFGSLGIPTYTLYSEVRPAGNDYSLLLNNISEFTLLQLFPLYVIIPFIILMLTERQKILSNLGMAFLTGITTFSIQFISIRYIGVELSTVVAAIGTIGFLILFSVVLKSGKKRMRINYRTLKGFFKAWCLYLYILIIILSANYITELLPDNRLDSLLIDFRLPVTNWNFRFSIPENIATYLLIGSFIGGISQGLKIKELFSLFCTTVNELKLTAITIISLIIFSSIMNNSGMTETLAIGIAEAAGKFYPYISPLIGGIGTFITGSNTSSNIIFGKFQSIAAHHLGLSSNSPIIPGLNGTESDWLIAANNSGATGGKMISVQSIAISTASCNIKGEEDSLLRKGLPYALIYVLIVGIIVGMMI